VSEEAKKGATTEAGTGSKQGGSEAEGKLKAQIEEKDNTISNLQSAKDKQADDLTKKSAADKLAHAAELAKEREEKALLKQQSETRAAEDKVELAELISEMEEAGQNAINALPESMSDRDKLLYVKKNKALLFKAAPPAKKPFGQPTGGGDSGDSGSKSFKPAPITQLTKGGKKAVQAERERLNKEFGGEQ